MPWYDVIVIGTGGVGSAAAFHLARRGARVLGLDRFPGGHAHGSSHGETRIIRKAYFEHPDYVPLLHRAYDLWRELEMLAREPLFRRVGLLQAGPAAGRIVAGVRDSARRHRLAVADMTPAEAGRRFPVALPDGHEVVFEADAGLLFVERCVLAHLRLAAAHGADLVTDAAVLSWRAGRDGIVVETEKGSHSADRLVVTAGAWAPQLLADLGIPFAVRRKHVHWYAADDPRYRADAGFPCFLFETFDGIFYGFPDMGDGTVKVAEHSGGAEIDDPLADGKVPDDEDRARVEAFIRSYLPGIATRPVRHEVCYYTMSPDEHFVVGRHPHRERVVLAAGLSGHGFKFTGVLGEILADLALDGATRHPVGFLSPERSGLQV